MSEVGVIVSPMKELEKQIEIARKALAEAKQTEEDSGYDDAMLSMERTYCEGFLEALEFIYTLQNGHGYDEQ